MNKAILIGRLGKDPELKAIQGGSLCHFTIATSESWSGSDGQKHERTEWHKIVVFGKLAEVCATHLERGAQVLIEGKIQTRQYEGKDGQKQYSTEIVAAIVTFLGQKKEASAEQKFSY
jgi:single-strand DNA-binding protein